mmetsp:Transcript_24763/g.57220  ORF Transcript_24763/g.57220 Transcript_24763/m.57220 type:complete len:1092 (-) Transcript_24763:164-3439(-)
MSFQYQYDIPNIPGLRRDTHEANAYAEAAAKATRNAQAATANLGAFQRPKSATARRKIEEAQAMDDELSIAGSKIDGVTTGLFQDTNPLSAAPRTRPSSAPARRKSGNRMARSQPSWVTDSGKVLRFKCFFEEDIKAYQTFQESFSTKKRVRKVTVDFFLADNSIAMNETKIANSGLPQGRFVARTKLQKPDGSFFEAMDFIVGGEFALNNRVFKVVDADTRTRKYFSEILGFELGAAVDYPDDGFAAERQRQGFNRPIKKTTAKKNYSTADRTVLRFFCAYEAPLPPSALGPGSTAAAAASAASSNWQNNPEVVDDKTKTMTKSGSTGDMSKMSSAQATAVGAGARQYTLHYFVADDTLEVKAIATEGVQSFPWLLRRRKLPKNSTNVPGGLRISHERFVGDEAADGEDDEPRMVGYEDLKCGDVVMVYNHPLLILGCDSTTKDWYAKKGITQRPLKVVPEDEDRMPIRVPAYNGYGAEDDLYAMGLKLQPAISSSEQEQYRQFMTSHDRILRFKAKVANLHTGDMDPTSPVLIINYFLADDTLSVFEPVVRNSGMKGGTFLNRMRYKKHITPKQGGGRNASSRRSGLLSRWFRPSDFVKGADVTFEMPSTGCAVHRFKIIDIDPLTMQIIEEGMTNATSAGEGDLNLLAPNELPQESESVVETRINRGKMALVLGRIAELCAVHTVPLRSSLRRMDYDAFNGTGKISQQAFVQCIRDLKDEMGKPLLPTKTLASDDLDLICWEFAAESPLTQTIQVEDSDGGVMVDYHDFVDAVVLACPEPTIIQQFNAQPGAHAQHLEEAMLKVLRNQFACGEMLGGRLRRTFREEDTLADKTVTSDQWFKVLRKHKFHSLMTRSRAEALRKTFEAAVTSSTPRVGADMLMDYNSLCDAVYPGDFNHYVDRLLVVMQDNSPAEAEAEAAWAVKEGRELPADDEVAEYEQTGMSDAMGMTAKPTMRTYLKEVNEQLAACGGDESKQLERAMRAFSCSFARTHRKKLLRKNMISYDLGNTGRLDKVAFLRSVDKCVSEGFVELDVEQTQRLASFFFPQPTVNFLDYEVLLEVICSRDLGQAFEMREAALVEQPNAARNFR